MIFYSKNQLLIENQAAVARKRSQELPADQDGVEVRAVQAVLAAADQENLPAQEGAEDLNALAAPAVQGDRAAFGVPVV